MNKFWIVVKHTYFKHLKSKAFVISTLITMFLISSLANVGKMYSAQNSKKIETIGIISTQSVKNDVKKELEKSNVNIRLMSYSSESNAKDGINHQAITAYLVIEKNTTHGLLATYKANEIVDQEAIFELTNVLNKVKKEEVIQSLHLKPNDIKKVDEPLDLKQVPLHKGAKSQNQIKQSMVIVFASLFLIYATVVFYGNMIATEVASEKSSRVMEVLVSSAPAVHQMFGKIFGLAFLSATQYAFFFVSGALSFQRSHVKLDAIPPITYVYSIIFLILGYFMYSTLLAMVGSLVSRIEDVHQIITPINVLIIIGFVLSLIGFIDPKSNVITVASMIPFFTPMLMFLRVALLTVPFWQILLSILLMIAFIVFFAILGAKVYKGGVLIYDKSSLKNIVKALKISKE